MTPTERSLARLAEMKQRADKATPGPWIRRGWHVEHKNRHTVRLEIKVSGIVNDIGPTADFVAASRTDIPKLIEALRRAVEVLISESTHEHAGGYGKIAECPACKAVTDIERLLIS